MTKTPLSAWTCQRIANLSGTRQKTELNDYRANIGMMYVSMMSPSAIGFLDYTYSLPSPFLTCCAILPTSFGGKVPHLRR